MVAAFSQDISASLSLPCALVIYLHLRNFLEGGLRGSRGPSHRHMPDPMRVFLSDQPPWILTRPTVSYKGSLWFLLLGRIVDETLYLSPSHGPRFYSPTLFFCKLNLENIKIIIYIYIYIYSKFWGAMTHSYTPTHGHCTHSHPNAQYWFE